jgi:hypothetical protein
VTYFNVRARLQAFFDLVSRYGDMKGRRRPESGLQAFTGRATPCKSCV